MFKIKINNKEIKLYESFSVNKSLDSFVDTFTITIGNPGGIFSKTIPIGSYINIYYSDIEIFRGICEKKEVKIGNVGSMLIFSGREELFLVTEEDISPIQKDYLKVSDNFIIKDITSGYGWNYELGEEKIITKYTIPNNGVRKGTIIDSVVNRNNFYIFKIGNTIYKKSLPSESNYTVRNNPQFTLSSQGGGFINYNNRILSVDISEDISASKSTIKGFTYGTSTSKPKIETELENTSLSTGIYPQRLRNISSSPMTAPIIDRFVSNSVEVGSEAELTKIVEKARITYDIKIGVDIVVAEFLDLHMLDTCEIFIQDEEIKQYMYITAISYNYDSNNKYYTSYTFTPIVPSELE